MPNVVELQLDARTATRAGGLDRKTFPGDSADRIIYATALECGTRLVSQDSNITKFDPARIVW
jgi:PIN domain nuclease of toxin-antitoxin system